MGKAHAWPHARLCELCRGHLGEEHMEADIQPARYSPCCGPRPEWGLPRGRGTFCYFHKVPYRLGWPDSRGEVSRERDFICRGESAEAGWCQWGGLDLHSDQEGLKWSTVWDQDWKEMM